MKKIFLALLLLAMTASLCACGSVELPPLPAFPSPAAPATPTIAPNIAVTPAPTLAAVETTPEVTPEPEPVIEEPAPTRVIVTFETHGEHVMDPATGEIDILDFSYVTPVVYLEGRDLPAAMINEYIAMLDESFYTGNDYGAGSAGGFNYMLEIAEDNFTYIWENRLISATLEYAATRDVRVERADDKLLDLVFHYYEFTGGAHGNYTDYACVFDTESGELLTLDKLSDDDVALTAYLLSAMLAQAEEDERISPDYIAEEDRPEAFRNLLREGGWYFDDVGLVIFANPYDIAPYAAGIIDFHIPYESLRGHVDEKWLPAERSEGGGFQIYPLDELEGGSVVLLDRVVLDENARELCLLAEGTVYDVALTNVIYMDQFYLGKPIWNCSYMTDCALQLCAMIPDGTPNLMLRYRSANGAQHTLLITESGENGSPMLVEENVPAAG